MSDPSPATERSHRRSWLWPGVTVLGLTLVGAAIGLAVALSTDEKWLVSAKVLVQIGPETAGSRPSMVGSPAPFLAGNPRREDVQTEVELLGSPDLLRRAFVKLLQEDPAGALGPESGRIGTAVREAIESLGLLPSRTREERALDKWVASLRVAVVPASTVLLIESRSDRPTAAERLLQLMLAEYMNDHRLAFGARGLAPVLGEFVREREGAMAAAEGELTRLRTGHDVVDVLQEVTTLVRRRAEAEAALQTLVASLAGARARADAAKHALEATPAEHRLSAEQRPDPRRDELELRLATARQSLTLAEQQFVADSPEVRTAREVVALLQGLAADVPAMRAAGESLGRNPLHDTLRELAIKTAAEVVALTAEREVAAATVQTIRDRLLAVEHGRAAIQKAERDVDEARKDLLQARDGARLAHIEKVFDDHGVANVTVVTPPTWLPTPLRSFGLPVRVAILAGGAFFGFALGVAVLLWRRAPSIRQPVRALPNENLPLARHKERTDQNVG